MCNDLLMSGVAIQGTQQFDSYKIVAHDCEWSSAAPSLLRCVQLHMSRWTQASCILQHCRDHISAQEVMMALGRASRALALCSGSLRARFTTLAMPELLHSHLRR